MAARCIAPPLPLPQSSFLTKNQKCNLQDIWVMFSMVPRGYQFFPTKTTIVMNVRIPFLLALTVLFFSSCEELLPLLPTRR